MKAVVLDGSRGDEEYLNEIRSALEGELGARGWELEVFELRNHKILPCTGCFDCWTKTPGICKIKDDGGTVTKSIVKSDLLVLLTPVTFGGYSSELKKALDRSLGIMLPYFTKIEGKVHHKKRYDTYPRLIVLGLLSSSDPEAERTFRTLVSRNAINAHSPGHTAKVFVKGAAAESIRSDIRKVLGEAGVEA